MTHTIILNKREVALLKSAARRGDDNSNFQQLLANLDQLLNDRTGQIQLDARNLELIQRYGCDTGKLSWHGTLFSIFGRTMSNVFGHQEEHCTELIDISKTPEPVQETEKRNWRTL